jgi:uncharacterized protein (TIGR02996 family)
MSEHTLTDEYIYRIAPDGKSIQAAQKLISNAAFRRPRMSAGGTRLEAKCQGSERKPYDVLVDLSNPERPRTSCNCISPKSPCKHALGLMLLAAHSGELFEHDTSSEPVRQVPRESVPPPEGAALVEAILRETRFTRAGAPRVTEAAPRKDTIEKRAAPRDTGAALLEAILAEPEEDGPRLIYADWLEENGGPAERDRAEFIRIQMELAGLPEDDPRRKKLQKRERQLWSAHREEWLEHVPPHLRNKRDLHFQRGFLEELSLAPAIWNKHGARLFAHHPLYRIRLPQGLEVSHASALAVVPHLSRVRVLSLHGCTIDEPLKTLQILFDTPFLTGLRLLDLSACGLTTRGVGVLAGSALLGRVPEIDLSDNQVGPGAVEALAAAPAVASVRVLSLRNNPIGDAGGKALAASPHLDGLQRLDLGEVALGEKVKEALRERFGDRVVLE